MLYSQRVNQHPNNSEENIFHFKMRAPSNDQVVPKDNKQTCDNKQEQLSCDVMVSFNIYLQLFTK